MSKQRKTKNKRQKTNLMWYQIRGFLSKLTLIAAIVLLLFISWDNFTIQPAFASIRQMEEAPGQILVQSRHTLKDNRGNSWQVVLFKRTKADGSNTIHLRLEDFPGLAEFAHPRPLTITTNRGDSFKAEDVFAEKAPAANVGEFDVQDVLSRLPVSKLNLFLAMKGEETTQLSIPSEVILEWQSVAVQG